MNKLQADYKQEILMLCNTVRTLIKEQRYEECKERISSAMQGYPHSPEPHNLMGIVLEKEDCHVDAMKHFRAAYALDPTYLPARHNLDHYATFFSKGACAYDESDCKTEATKNEYAIEYNERGIGRAIRRE